jgi:hypothetical protein
MSPPGLFKAKPELLGMWKWNALTSPSIMGGFPAATWLYHKNHVKRGAPVVEEKRDLVGDLWDVCVPVISEDMHFDPNRAGTRLAYSNVSDGAPYGAYLVGPVEIEYGKDGSGTRIHLDGLDYDELNKGVAVSNTGELRMDATKGLFILDAPCAQGATAFFQEIGATVSTGNLDINLENEYACVIAVSLDDKPLSESGKVLLQITTLSRPRGWRETPARYSSSEFAGKRYSGFRVDTCGDGAYWEVKSTRGTVTIRNNTLSKATLADPHFYAAGAVPVERQGGGLLVKLPPNAMYVVLE